MRVGRRKRPRSKLKRSELIEKIEELKSQVSREQTATRTWRQNYDVACQMRVNEAQARQGLESELLVAQDDAAILRREMAQRERDHKLAMQEERTKYNRLHQAYTTVRYELEHMTRPDVERLKQEVKRLRAQLGEQIDH